MPSLRQKVTTYFRQLSFIAEPRGEGPRSPRKTEDDGNFIIKYLEGRLERNFSNPPEIFNGHDPADLPELRIANYPTGPSTITAACTGPDDGLTGIKRSKLHLSASYADDIDFIDTIQEENDSLEVRKSITNNPPRTTKFGRFPSNRKLSSTVTTPTNDQNANKTFSGTSQSNAGMTTSSGMRSRKNSKSSISKEAGSLVPKLKYGVSTRKEDNSNKSTTITVSMVSSTKVIGGEKITPHDVANDQNNKNILNAKTESITKELTKDPKTNISALIQSTKDNTNASTHAGSKILEDCTERLLREAVSSQGNAGLSLADPIASVSNWKMENDCAYGISVSLYENNMLTKEPTGNPIADCYGMVVRGNAAAMALADGVNWGDGARLAARSAVHGCLDYLDRAIFGLSNECMASTTQEVFVSLLRSLWEGHGCILEVGGALSTLTIAVVLPLVKVESPIECNAAAQPEKYVVCACNVGDSLGYVYSKKYGVREFTQASHDITSMRDMRDALGALGPADGNKPELSNLTLSMTVIERGDIVFLTSDGISDNFDPVVGKFAEAWTPDVKLMSKNANAAPFGVLAPKRQNKSASAIYARLHSNEKEPNNMVRTQRTKKSPSPGEQNTFFSSSSAFATATAAPSRPKYMRSHTVIEQRHGNDIGHKPIASHQERGLHSRHPHVKIPRSTTGLPLVTGPQRHALTLHRLEDLLSYGINGTFSPCTSARRVCHLLIDFVRMITSARRKTLEQRELFYKLAMGADGIRREVELNRMQHRAARRRIVDSSAFTALPGKLDHATVVAYIAGGELDGNTDESVQEGTGENVAAETAPLKSQEFRETNF